ncbi:MAG TPA: TonB-dependent receptor [Vicinamibacterales bacterium]|nr:TonB-dependent receptor [Vicinamibacterales bacterium]
MRKPMKACVTCLAVVMILGLPALLLAQGTGAISGTVTDTTSGVLPGATVVVKNTETGQTREVITDLRGHYSAPNLQPGPYDVMASLTGFGTVTRSGVRLTVGREAVVDIALTVGTLQDAITVVGEAPTVDMRSSSTGALISQEQIAGLPLNGRSFIELANLTPGVQLTDNGGRSTSTGFGAKLSVNGSRYTANLFTIDGTMLNDQFNQAGSASGNVLGVEAIGEFQVLTNSFSAEFGRHTGAVINAVTKSGTNNFRGSLFEFHRGDNLNSRGYFDTPDRDKPDFNRNQLGFSAGAPVKKDRLFIFATYEGLRETLGTSQTFNVFSQALRDRAAAQNSPTLPYIMSYPLPNGRSIDANRGEFIRQANRETVEDYAVLRVDGQLSDRQSAFVRYTFDNGEVTNPVRVTTGEKVKTQVHFVTASHQIVKGSGFVNRAQLGITRSRLDGVDYVYEGLSLPRTTFTDIDRGIAAISVSGGIAGWGGSTTNPKFHRFSNYQISDVVILTKGMHSFRAGGQVEFLHFDLTSDFTSMGNYTFNSINDFLAGVPRTFDAVMPGSDATRNLRQRVFGFFAQDDMQVSSRLTINAGVRYEPTTDVTDTGNRLAQLIDFANPRATLNDTTKVDALYKNPSLKTVAPRLGFAWDITGSGKSALRGGAGVFYDLVTVNTPFVQNTAVRVPPFFNRGGLVASATSPITFPEAYATQSAQLAGQAQLEGIEYDPKQPVMYKWNLNFQRELTGRTTLEVGYTGTRGKNLFRQIFSNGRNAVEVNGRLVVPADAPLIQPAFGRMRYRVSDADSWYRGLTVSVSRRAHSFSSQISYTLSKSEDTGAAALGSNDFDGEGAGSRYLFTPDKGRSPFDIRHSLVASVTYMLPFGQNGSGVVSHIIRDWEIGSLVRLRSGQPFSVFVGYDQSLQVWSPVYPDLAAGASANPILGSPDKYYDPLAFVLPAPGVIGNAPRNSLIGPGYATWDLNTSRNVPFGTRTLQLRFEVFNLLNRANFGIPAQSLFAANGTRLADAGRITTLASAPRQAQLGVKFVW